MALLEVDADGVTLHEFERDAPRVIAMHGVAVGAKPCSE